MLPFATYVREDGRLVTGQNPASAGAVGEVVVAKLKAVRQSSVDSVRAVLTFAIPNGSVIHERQLRTVFEAFLSAPEISREVDSYDGGKKAATVGNV